MGILSKLFGVKFNDEQLEFHAANALIEDPLINDPAGVNVFSERGIVTITGSVHRNREKEHIEGVIRSAYGAVGLKHNEIVNRLELR